MKLSSKRAEYVAMFSLALSVIFWGLAFFIGRWSGSFAISAIGWYILSSALIWAALVIQFHQRSLAEQEKLDITQLAKGRKESTIFQPQDERATIFVVAQRRLDVLEKYFLPIFAGLIAAYQLALGAYLLKALSHLTEHQAKQPLVCAICMTTVAFVSFLISRYATGMSAQQPWKPLKAGGSSFIGVAVLCFVAAIGLALLQFNILVVVKVISFVVPVLLLTLGIETALNIVLDIYRPRLADQYSRSAFDTRLLGLLNEPGGVFHTLASTIDYQFGFKVSQTWFYKLLEKAIAPLVLFAAVALYLLSCVVVVAPNEEAIIEHLGNPLNDTGQVRLVGPGLAFKWPWPVDIAYKRSSKKVMQLNIGFVAPEESGGKVGYGPLLWGKAHYQKEYLLLVAGEQTAGKSAPGAVPVSLVIATVPVHYKIKDLYSFIYNHNQPEKMLESICYRELTKFAAGARIEVESEADMDISLLGAGRAEAERILTNNVQAAADKAGLGVEIVFLGLQGIHPPPEVAPDYQKVVGAVQKKQALVLEAHSTRNRILGDLAGSVEDADALYGLAAEYQQAGVRNDSDAVEKLGQQLDQSFAEAKGDIFGILRQAQSYAFEKSVLAEATGERFASQLKAYKASKDFYQREQKLAVYENMPKNIRKFVVVADQNDKQVFIFDAQEKPTPSLYELAGLEETTKK